MICLLKSKIYTIFKEEDPLNFSRILVASEISSGCTFSLIPPIALEWNGSTLIEVSF